METVNQSNDIRPAVAHRGWAILSLGLVMLARAFLIWVGVGLLNSAGAVIGGNVLPMSRSSLTDAQTFYVLLLYVSAFVSFGFGLKILLGSIRRMLA